MCAILYFILGTNYVDKLAKCIKCQYRIEKLCIDHLYNLIFMKSSDLINKRFTKFIWPFFEHEKIASCSAVLNFMILCINENLASLTWIFFAVKFNLSFLQNIFANILIVARCCVE